MTDKNQRMEPTAKDDSPAWVLFLCFGFFLALGGVFLAFVFLDPVLDLWVARHWRETPCTIESSELKKEIKEHSATEGGARGDTPVYRAVVRYSYQFEGTQHRSDRHDVLGGASSWLTKQQEIVGRYTPGSEAVCYVNPDNPDEAVLSREIPHLLWFGLIPAAAFLTGLFGLVFATRYTLQKRRNAKPPTRIGPDERP